MRKTIAFLLIFIIFFGNIQAQEKKIKKIQTVTNCKLMPKYQ